LAETGHEGSAKPTQPTQLLNPDASPVEYVISSSASACGLFHRGCQGRILACPRLAFWVGRRECGFGADEVIIAPRLTRLRLLSSNGWAVDELARVSIRSSAYYPLPQGDGHHAGSRAWGGKRV